MYRAFSFKLPCAQDPRYAEAAGRCSCRTPSYRSRGQGVTAARRRNRSRCCPGCPTCFKDRSRHRGHRRGACCSAAAGIGDLWREHAFNGVAAPALDRSAPDLSARLRSLIGGGCRGRPCTMRRRLSGVLMAVAVERKGGCRARPCKLQCKLRTKVYHDLALLSPSVLSSYTHKSC